MSDNKMPPDGDVTRGPALLAIFWTQIIISGIFVALRFYVKKRLRSTGIEDWTMLICWVTFLASFSLASVAVLHGMGRHVYYLKKHGHSLHEFLKWHRIVPPFGFMSLLFGKLSVSLLLLRILGPKSFWRKWFLYSNMALYTIIMILASILGFVQCNPPRALWDTVPGAKCWTPEAQVGWSTFRSSYSSFLDFALAILPITIVWNLQMGTERKIGFCVLLGAGILCGICAALKASLWKSQTLKDDITYGTFGLYAWTSSELFLNIICGTIPSLNPLYQRIFRGRPIGGSTKVASTHKSAIQMGNKREEFSGKRRPDASNVDSQVSTLAERPYNSTDGRIHIDRSFDVESQSQSISEQQT